MQIENVTDTDTNIIFDTQTREFRNIITHIDFFGMRFESDTTRKRIRSYHIQINNSNDSNP